jgi:hypothetical protein
MIIFIFFILDNYFVLKNIFLNKDKMRIIQKPRRVNKSPEKERTIKN